MGKFFASQVPYLFAVIGMRPSFDHGLFSARREGLLPFFGHRRTLYLPRLASSIQVHCQKNSLPDSPRRGPVHAPSLAVFLAFHADFFLSPHLLALSPFSISALASRT